MLSLLRDLLVPLDGQHPVLGLPVASWHARAYEHSPYVQARRLRRPQEADLRHAIADRVEHIWPRHGLVLEDLVEVSRQVHLPPQILFELAPRGA